MKHLIILLGFLFAFHLGNGQTYLPQVADSNNQIIEHTAYTLSYNETCEQANWVTYMLTKTDLEKDRIKRKSRFKSDTLVATESASPGDYKYTGYDRGHLAPAADFTHDNGLMLESFYMSNMSPQVPGFNRGVWKRLENEVRRYALKEDTVHVITGGILGDSLKTIGDNEVCVPEHYYKIIYSNDGTIACYLIKNAYTSQHIRDFLVPLIFIEDLTGFNFMIKP